LIEVFFKDGKRPAFETTASNAWEWVNLRIARWRAHRQIELRYGRGAFTIQPRSDISLRMRPSETEKAAQSYVPSVHRFVRWGFGLVKVNMTAREMLALDRRLDRVQRLRLDLKGLELK